MWIIGEWDEALRRHTAFVGPFPTKESARTWFDGIETGQTQTTLLKGDEEVDILYVNPIAEFVKQK